MFVLYPMTKINIYSNKTVKHSVKQSAIPFMLCQIPEPSYTTIGARVCVCGVYLSYL